MSKYARKVDGNQAEIVEALTKAGYIVHNCSRFGGGFPDLMVQSKIGIIALLEVKIPGEKLTPAEKKFYDNWVLSPVYIVDSAENALKTMRMVDFVYRLVAIK